ncbi:MAG: glycosyltransferase family 4 protein [Myxococcota bacterium]
MTQPFRVVNVSDSRAGFRWLDGLLPDNSGVEFSSYDRSSANRLERALESRQNPDLAGYRASYQAAREVARGGVDLLVTHLPTYAARVAALRGAFERERQTPHLAWAFNFTHLPQGPKRSAMTRIYRDIERFLVFSSMEKRLYADYLEIPDDRITFLHWGIRPPEPLEETDAPKRDFLLSVGRTRRDYKVLIRAMARLPHRHAIIVSSPEHVAGVDIPPNVEVKIEIPFGEVLSLTQACRFSVLPLATSDLPFGHGTLVLAMFMKKPIIVSKSVGFEDYITHDKSALEFTPGDDEQLAAQIEDLFAHPQKAEALANEAFSFAHQYCTEQSTIEWFMDCVQRVREGGQP